MRFRAIFGIRWSGGGVSVEKYVQGIEGFMQITPLRKDPIGGPPLRQWSDGGAVEYNFGWAFEQNVLGS